MSLSISCPSCGKQFRKIKAEMAGKKARCSCGEIVRLGPKKSNSKKSKRKRRKKEPSDLLDIDLLADEMLGDQLLGDFSQDEVSTEADPPPVQSAVVPSLTPNPNRKTDRGSKKRSQVPEVSPTVDDSSKPGTGSEAPLPVPSFDDLDDILAGAGNAAPLIARPGLGEPRRGEEGATSDLPLPKKSYQASNSPLGFGAALGSGTLALWFGLLVVVSRFQIIPIMLVERFSQQLQLGNTAMLGTAEVSGGYQFLFIALGWLLWGVATLLIFVGVGQFFNTVIQLISKRQPLRSADGLAATLGVSAVFLIVAMVFAQAMFANQQYRSLDEIEHPFITEGEHLGNVSRLREEIGARSSAFTVPLLVGATVPMTIFMLSMVRLFTKNSNRSVPTNRI